MKTEAGNWRYVFCAAWCFLALSTSIAPLLNAHIAHASINKQLSFYGTLQNTAGVNLAGTYDMVFRLYDAPTGGTLLDTSTHTVSNGNPVTVENGHFGVKLGSGAGNALDGVDFNSGTIYVGITIGSDSEMIPREQLTSAAYSFNSDSLDGYDSLDFLRLNATNTIAFNSTQPVLTVRQNGTGDVLNILDGAINVFSIIDGGNVGIGTTTPTSKLTISGDIRIIGALKDTTGDSGTLGQLLTSTLTGTNWIDASTLGFLSSTSGNWSGTFDGQEGSYYLSNSFATSSADYWDNTKTPRTADNLTDNSLEDLQDVTVMTKNYGDLLYWNGTAWSDIATSSLGISGGGGSSLFTDGGATTYLTALNDNLAIGTTSAQTRLTVAGDITLAGGSKINFGNNHYFYASTTLWSYAIGQEAGLNNSGYDNFFVGDSAGYNNTGDENNIMGFRAGETNSGSNNNILGLFAGYGNSGSSNNIFGDYAGETNSGSVNVLIGPYSGQNNTGSQNYFIGGDAGRNNQGNVNIGIGYGAGGSNQGNQNIMFGDSAGNGNKGRNNILIGIASGQGNQGNYNSFLGEATGYVNSGSYNALLGYQTGYYLSATGTVAVGAESLYGGAFTYAAVNNTTLGYRTGYNAQTGASNNILVGYQAASNLTTGANNIIIGYNVDSITPSANNRLNVGNLLFGTSIDGTGTTLSSGKIGIGTSTPLQKLQVRGDIRIGTAGTNGCLENYGGGVIGGTCSSDVRLKSDILEFSTSTKSYLAGIVELKPVTYHWNQLANTLYHKDQGINNIGLVAQNVEDVFPELVSVNSEGYRQVDFQALPFYMIEAIKELWFRVSGLEEKVKEIDDLKERVDRLEKQNAPYGPITSNESEPQATNPPENAELPVIEPASDTSQDQPTIEQQPAIEQNVEPPVAGALEPAL